MLTMGITERLDVPGEEGQWIEVRRLSWKHLADARKARQEAVFATVRAMGGEVLKSLPSRCSKGCGEEKHEGRCTPVAQRADQAATDPVNEFDIETLLQSAVVGWSYEETVSKDTISDLSEPTANWLAAEIVRLNTTPAEGAQKN